MSSALITLYCIQDSALPSEADSLEIVHPGISGTLRPVRHMPGRVMVQASNPEIHKVQLIRHAPPALRHLAELAPTAVIALGLAVVEGFPGDQSNTPFEASANLEAGH